MSTEQEVRKVLGKKFTKCKRQIAAVISIFLFAGFIGVIYWYCIEYDISFLDSWPSGLSETAISLILLIMQINFINKIFSLIEEADLDMIPIKQTYRKNVSVVGFIFII